MHHTWETTLASYTGRFSFNTSLYLMHLKFAGVRSKCTPSWLSCELNQPKGCIHSSESSVLLADMEQSHCNLAGIGGWRNQLENNFTVAKHRTCRGCPFAAPRPPALSTGAQVSWWAQAKPLLQHLSAKDPGEISRCLKVFQGDSPEWVLCMTRPYTFALHSPFLNPIAVF